MEILVGVLAVLLLIAVVALVVRSLGGDEPGPSPRPWERGEPGGSVVVLDMVPDDPEHDSVQRLVEEVGRRALLAAPELDEVEVRDREGRALGTVRPPPPLPAELSLPPELHEPHTRPSRVPSPVPRESSTRHVPTDDRPVEHAHSLFSEQFDLGPDIRGRLRDPDDPVDVVRAILETGGYEPEVSGDLLRLDHVAIVILPATWHATDDALARSFLRIQRARVERGVIIHLAWLNPETLRRREAAAPNVRHVGPEAIQRMADAVVAGADPITFAVGPAVVR
jgi:hypothetical protein